MIRHKNKQTEITFLYRCVLSSIPGTVLTSIVSYINSSILTIYSIWGVISHIFYTLNSISKITDSSKLFTLRPNLKNLM